MTLWDQLRTDLDERTGQGLKRELQVIPAGMLELASNDYLGLSHHPEVIQAAQDATGYYGAGSRASRLLSGNLAGHVALESALAAWKGCEAALVFPTGYSANLGTIGALSSTQSLVCCHKRNHASLVDACRLALANGATVRYFDDNDKLDQLLSGGDYARRLIVVDGVFSMDGDVWDLPVGLQLAERHDAVILLDDAHASGTLGQTGRGSAEYFGIQGRLAQERIITIGTLSKAFGGQGGFVAGSQLLVDYLVNRSRAFIYTTALAPSLVAAARAALQIIQREPERVARLQRNGKRLAGVVSGAGLRARLQPSPILPVLVGEANDAMNSSSILASRGVWCPAIRPPTVPVGTSRLRLTVSSEWTDEDWERIERAFSTYPPVR